MLRVKNLAKNLGMKELLKKINFTINNNSKVALIGPNGCGKTTLFKLILGEIEPDAGQVILQDERIGYLPQEIILPTDQTVQTFLEKQVERSDERWKVERILSLLGMTDINLDQLTVDLSEGQKMKLKLAEILISEPTLLLLDEPTNHLDIEGILWFEKFVQNYQGSILMISHDRSFLDHTIDTVIEIDEGEAIVFPGNYTDYKLQKEIWVAKREQAYKQQERKRAQLEQLIENMRRIKDGKKRGKAIRSAKKRMEREVVSNQINQYREYGITGMHIEGETHKHKLILSVEGVNKNYEDKQVLNNLSFEIRGRERVWLFGYNGAGKTTLLNIITGNLEANAGISRIGENVKWGYFRQNQEHMPKDMKVGKYLNLTAGFDEPQSYRFLTRFNYQSDYINRPLGSLSPGERARLSFGIFTQQEYTFLILDEPTNHLDIWTKEVIEDALQNFKGAVLLVSHDRYFVENVNVDRVLNLNQTRLEFPRSMEDILKE